jgi:hypothetical protein
VPVLRRAGATGLPAAPPGRFQSQCNATSNSLTNHHHATTPTPPPCTTTHHLVPPPTTSTTTATSGPEELVAKPHAGQPRLLAPQAYKILGRVRKARGGAFAVLKCELARFTKCSEQLRETTYLAKAAQVTKKRRGFSRLAKTPPVRTTKTNPSTKRRRKSLSQGRRSRVACKILLLCIVYSQTCGHPSMPVKLPNCGHPAGGAADPAACPISHQAPLLLQPAKQIACCMLLIYEVALRCISPSTQRTGHT